jgi:hypothetical protein
MRAKLFINTNEINSGSEFERFLEEVKHYSITPTTLSNRTFFTSHTDLLFKEHYEYRDNSTIRFGINICDESFRKQLIEDLTIHNEALQNRLSDANERCSNISGVTKYQEFCPKYIELTEHENFAIQSTLRCMEEEGRKVALVDIFPRESSNKNQIVVGGINTNKLDVHTVLLYKTATNQILVIDPNNPMFSSHLSKYDNGSVIQTLCTTDQKYKIYSRPEKSETGFGQEKFRDCIDLAVKLAFLLNQDQTPYLTIDDIMASNAVRLITNNSAIDGMVFTPQDLVRLKQSSNIEKIMQCNEQMQTVSRQETQKAQEALKLFQKRTEEIKLEYESKMKEINTEHKEQLVALCGEYDNYLDGDSI